MRIAIVASNAVRVPPKKYGGTERVVHTLTEHLVKRGHEVTLFASGDSLTSARLIPTAPRAVWEMNVNDPFGYNTWLLYAIGLAYSMQDEFDIIHDHNGLFSLPAAHLTRIPTLVTWHGPFSSQIRQLFQTMNAPYVNSISESQLRNKIGLNYTRSVYNGLDMEHYPFSEEDDGYLLFVGRISMEKGPHYAIQVAQELNIPLIMAAKMDSVDQAYFKEYIEPKLKDSLITWVGEVDEEERNRLMSKAKALLHPVTFREPFGLVMIEAMACGCPVIGFNKGSIPEVIRNGKTGFVVEDADEMLEAVERIDEVDRAYCRDYALDRFGGERMAKQYETLYREIIDREIELRSGHSASAFAN
jgi:glycosyltransferase involved in cell wall biosynthesis